jgi:predicted nucleic acid-binding protein
MIISDSTILITLINIDEFDVLKKYTNNIIITDEVYGEVAVKPYAKNYLDKEIKKRFIKIQNYTNKKLFNEINIILDKGEASSISLALESALPLIIDEKKGRKFALIKGIKVLGLVGILRYLYLEDKISKNKAKLIIEKLNCSKFRVSRKLLELILKEN